MSYDLFFTARAPVRRAELHRWLASQPNAFASEERVGFENEHTGVYFGFDFQEGEALPAFNLNFVRPHVFALEAAPLLDAFVRHFSLGVDDPQHDGMGDGPWSIEGFLRGWNAGNAMAYRAVFGDGTTPRPPSLPAASNHLAWTWNTSRDAVRVLFEDDPSLPPAFAPTVFLVESAEGAAHTLSTWTADMPLIFPAGLDLLSVPAPRGTVILRVNEVLERCPPVHTWAAERPDASGRPIGTPSVIIDAPDDATRQALFDLGRAQQLTRLSVDHVLDRETLEAALTAR